MDTLESVSFPHAFDPRLSVKHTDSGSSGLTAVYLPVSVMTSRHSEKNDRHLCQ